MRQWVRDLNTALGMLTEFASGIPLPPRQNEDLLKRWLKATESHFRPESTCYKARNERTINSLSEKGKKVQECLPGKHSAPGRGGRKRVMKGKVSERISGPAGRRSARRFKVSGSKVQSCEKITGTNPTAVTDRRYSKTKPFRTFALFAPSRGTQEIKLNQS